MSQPTRKIDIAYERVLDILQEDRRRVWHLDDLRWEVNWALDLDDMVSRSTLRKAIQRLPEGCVQRSGRRITVQARHFASRDEMIAALRALPHWADDLPVLIERHRPVLRRTLALADERALYQSLEWAKVGKYEIDYTVYGAMVRWQGRAA